MRSRCIGSSSSPSESEAGHDPWPSGESRGHRVSSGGRSVHGQSAGVDDRSSPRRGDRSREFGSAVDRTGIRHPPSASASTSPTSRRSSRCCTSLRRRMTFVVCSTAVSTSRHWSDPPGGPQCLVRRSSGRCAACSGGRRSGDCRAVRSSRRSDHGERCCTWWYTLFMPTARPRHPVTETPEVAEILDQAVRRWGNLPRSKLIQLILDDWASGGSGPAARAAARTRLEGSMRGTAGVYVRHEDWPA